MNDYLVLVIGRALFLGSHSIRIFADGWRSAMMARVGERGWKAGFALVSLVGFYLIVVGYADARLTPTVLWPSPIWTRHLTALLTVPAFVLAAAAYVPRNHFRRAIGHPLLAGTKTWALAHLLANGTLADLLLFGSFLVWALLAFRNSRRRDRAERRTYATGTLAGTSIALMLGLGLWALFAFKLHGMLIGVRPFG